MRIVTALERFRTDDSRTIPFDHLTAIDTTTDFPIVDDPVTKKPMLFYCFEEEWFRVAGVVSKPYTKVFSTITAANKELNFCRRQIETFHRAYFDPPKISLLDDPRQNRIPLVNLLRYYATWKYIAAKADDKVLTVARIEDDFKLIVDSALDRYMSLLSMIAEKIRGAAGNGEMPMLFENLGWLQEVVDIPAIAVGEKHRDAIVSVLVPCAEIETGIENRIKAELPRQIELLDQSNVRLPVDNSLEVAPASFQWQDLLEFETEHQAIVDDYCRAGCINETLLALRSSAHEFQWNVCTNPDYNAAFNSTDVGSVHSHLSVAHPEGADPDVYGYLLPYDLAGGESGDMLSDLRQMISTAPYARNLMHQIVLLHLFLPYDVTGLQFNREGHTRKQFVKAASKLRGCLSSLAKLELDDMLSVSVRLEKAWKDWKAPMGFGYHLLMNLGSELMRGTAEDAAKLLADRCGSARERMFDQLSRSQLHRLFSDAARDIGNSTTSEFAKQHFEEFGFIVTRHAVAPIPDTLMDTAVVESPVDRAVSVPEFCATEYIVGKTISKAWDMKHNRNYLELTSDVEKWGVAKAVIRREATEILDEIAGDHEVDLDDRMNKSGMSRDIKGVLIARWVQIGLEVRETTLDDRIRLLGWTLGKNLAWVDPGKLWNAYYHYFHARGFLMSKVGAILPKSFLWPEERDWFLEHRRAKMKSR